MHIEIPHDGALLMTRALAVLAPTNNPAAEDAVSCVRGLGDGFLRAGGGWCGAEVRRKEHELRELPLGEAGRGVDGDDEQGVVDPSNAGGEGEGECGEFDLLDGVIRGGFGETEGGDIAAASPGNYSGTNAGGADGGGREESAGGPWKIGLNSKHHRRHREAKGERRERENFESLERGGEGPAVNDLVRRKRYVWGGGNGAFRAGNRVKRRNRWQTRGE